jgi:hypothetical protein
MEGKVSVRKCHRNGMNMTTHAATITKLKQPTLRTKLTDSYVRGLLPRKKVFAVKDSEVKQLSVLIQTTGSKAYYIQQGQKKRKIESTAVMSIAEARHQCSRLLAVGLEANKLSGKTLATAFDEYLASRAFSKGFESNLNQCKRIYRKLLKKPLETVSKDDVVNGILTARKASGSPLADSTKDSALNVLSSVFSYQLALETITINPVKNVKKRIPRLAINKRSNRLSTAQDFASFIEWFRFGLVAGSGVSHQNVKDFELIKLTALFLLLTGCRVGEAVDLRKEDFFLNREGLTDSGVSTLFDT